MKRPAEIQPSKWLRKIIRRCADHINFRVIHPQSGQELVEFALVLPFLLLLLLGTIELGVAIHDKQVITNASREGARAGIIAQETRPSDDDIRNVVNEYCTNYLITLSGAHVPLTTATRAGSNPGDHLTVTVTYDYGFLVLPGFITSLINPLRLSATTVMGLE